MNRRAVASSAFTDKELRDALRDAELDYEWSVSRESPESARHAHIVRTALRRWVNQREEAAKKQEGRV